MKPEVPGSPPAILHSPHCTYVWCENTPITSFYLHVATESSQLLHNLLSDATPSWAACCVYPSHREHFHSLQTPVCRSQCLLTQDKLVVHNNIIYNVCLVSTSFLLPVMKKWLLKSTFRSYTQQTLSAILLQHDFICHLESWVWLNLIQNNEWSLAFWERQVGWVFTGRCVNLYFLPDLTFMS